MTHLKLFLIALIAVVFALGFRSTPPADGSNKNLSIPKISGKQLFVLKDCSSCHTMSSKDEGKLTGVKTAREDAWFEAHLAEHSKIVLRQEKSKRRKKRVAKAEAMAIKAFLFEASPAERKQIDALSETVFTGAYAVAQNNCLRCHKIAGVGRSSGPELTEVAKERDRKFFLANLNDPKQFAPETTMKSYSFLGDETLAAIASYLETLK